MGKKQEQQYRFGRYAKFSPEIIEEIKEYIAECRDAYVRHKVVDPDTGEQLMYEQDSQKPVYLTQNALQVKIPSMAGLAVHLGVVKKTLYNWKEQDPEGIEGVGKEEAESLIAEYLELVDFIEAAQEQKLISGGLSGLYNSNVCKMLLTKHGYSDKVQHDASEQLIDALHGKQIAN